MPAVWTYPWTLDVEGVDTACRSLADRGVDTLNLGAHYHSIRSMHPRFPDDLFRSAPGGCWFDPDPERFEATPIDPPVNQVEGMDDPVAEIVECAGEHGLDVNAWTVCLHNSRLGAHNPEFRIESAFGDGHDHALCPSNHEVRAYFAAVIEALADRGVSGIHLESIGFQSPFHEHGWEWGHGKRHALTGRTEEILLAQCFCDGCRAAAEDHSVDFKQARNVVQDLLGDALGGPRADLPSVEELVAERPVLQELFAFRASVVTEFVAGLADAAGSVPLTYYVMEAHLGVDPGDLWPAGVRLEALDPSLDRAMAMCYVAEPSVARERVHSIEERVSCAVDAGLTLDPEVLDNEARFLDCVAAVGEAATETAVYHHGLMTHEHLDWLETAFAE